MNTTNEAQAAKEFEARIAKIRASVKAASQEWNTLGPRGLN
jgi:hypothetical protein